MKLFVDDTRDFPCGDFECCRDAKSAKILLSVMKFELVSLDYSLGHNRETGLSILMWMKENDIFVPEIVIHSNNIKGKERMKKFCEENFPDSKVTMWELSK